ncbi:MAG: hypothetical protein K2H40_12525 [Lachnospiraceae bacterium]|nr:hypothetical protein [Lachnospiraceae bacterium]
MSSVKTDSAVCEVVGRYLNGMLLDLNLRLLCDAEPESGGFPQRILWVEEVTMLLEEEGARACSREEKYCLEERPSVEGKESAFTRQIKYIVKKIKDRFKSLWKRKGREYLWQSENNLQD